MFVFRISPVVIIRQTLPGWSNVTMYVTNCLHNCICRSAWCTRWLNNVPSLCCLVRTTVQLNYIYFTRLVFLSHYFILWTFYSIAFNFDLETCILVNGVWINGQNLVPVQLSPNGYLVKECLHVLKLLRYWDKHARYIITGHGKIICHIFFLYRFHITGSSLRLPLDWSNACIYRCLRLLYHSNVWFNVIIELSSVEKLNKRFFFSKKTFTLNGGLNRNVHNETPKQISPFGIRIWRKAKDVYWMWAPFDLSYISNLLKSTASMKKCIT